MIYNVINKINKLIIIKNIDISRYIRNNNRWFIMSGNKKYLINNFKEEFNCFKKYIIKYPNILKDFIWIIENTNAIIEYDENISMNLIKKYKHKWFYCILSKNPNLTEEFILKYPYKDWDIKYLIKNNKITNFKLLSRFKNINQEIINDYFNKPWDLEWLIQNTDIVLEKYIPLNLIKKYSYKWFYFYLSKNLNITEEFILKYPYKNWDIEYLIENNKITDFNTLSKFKNINQDIIDNYPDKLWNWEWLIENTNINIKKYKSKLDYYFLSYNPNITEEFILKYPDQNWDIEYLIENNKITDFIALSKFKNINQKIIFYYPNKPWDWEWLIQNTSITIERYIPLYLIEKYKYNWFYCILSFNLNITEEFILNYPNQFWNIDHLIENNKITNFKLLSRFKYINKYTIIDYPDKPWDWEWLIENTNIDVEKYIPLYLIEKYSYKWNCWDLSYNPNLTEEFILKHLYKEWDIEYLIDNNKITDFKSLSKFKYIDKDKINKYIDINFKKKLFYKQ